MGPTAKHDLFGREDELAALRAQLASAMQGAGRLVLIEGDAGIGKTALLSAHAREAQARGALVAWGRCHEMQGAPAYWPWLRVLEDLVESKQLPEIESDELAALREGLRTAGTRDEPAAGFAADRFVLFARIARGLSAAAQKRGLLLAIDDLHWSDAASLELLRFLASELASDAILVLATLRSHEAGSERIAAELSRLAQSFPLGPLERGAVQALLDERLPDAPPTHTPASHAPDARGREHFVDEVWRRCGGNPFFVLELGQLLRAGGTGERAGVEPSGVPFAIKRVLDLRLARLRPEVIEVLRSASVVGGAIDLALLAETLDRPVPELRGLLEPLVCYGLLETSPQQANHFAFVHALVREALYESLDTATKADLHARVGAALEARLERDRTPSLRAETLPAIAHHYHGALQGDAPDADSLRGRAAEFARQAGSQLLEVLAYEEAVLHLERASGLLRDTSDPARRVEVEIALGEALIGLGDRARAETVLEATLGRARSEADPVSYASAVLAWCGAREEIGVADFVANEHVERAVAALPDRDSSLRARLLARLSMGLHLIRGEEERRRALSDQALAMAERLADVSTIAYVLIRRLVLFAGPDQLDERFAVIETMLERCADHATGRLHALSMQIDACAEAGDRAGLDAAHEAFDEQARASRHPYFVWLRASHRAALTLLEGRFDEAEPLIVEALALGQHAQSQTPGLHFAQQMFMLRGWQDRIAEVAPLIEGSAQTASIVPAWRCALADLYEYLDRRTEARREFDAVAQDAFASLPRDTTWLTSIVLLASVCARFEDRAHAETLYRMLAPYGGRVAVASPLIVAICPVDTRLGQLATLLARFDAAEQHFDRAADLARSMRAPGWQAEIEYHQGQLERARGGAGAAERAAGHFEAAGRAADALSMALLHRWIAEAGTPDEAASETRRVAQFVREGDDYILTFEGRTTRLRSMVGLAHIRALLAEPDREHHVLDLTGAAADPGDGGPLLDAEARDAYRERVDALRGELDEARARNDAALGERLSEELEHLTAELSRAFGLDGRERRAGAAAERARVSVTRAIKYATRRIAQHDSDLAEHLERNIRTGAFCVYAPSARERMDWQL